MTEDLIACEGEGCPQLDAQFTIEGPDGDGYVWICSTRGRQHWCHNLGSSSAVQDKLESWLKRSRH